MGGRRKAREQALQVLCMMDSQPDLPVEQALLLFQRHLAGSEPEGGSSEEEAEAEAEAEDPGQEQRPFYEALVSGVQTGREDLDGMIGRSSRNWRLERMNWVDRNLLRMAAYELRSCTDVPAKVAINEAIELAKRFGTGESPAFVNGVLDRLMADLGRRT